MFVYFMYVLWYVCVCVAHVYVACVLHGWRLLPMHAWSLEQIVAYAAIRPQVAMMHCASHVLCVNARHSNTGVA